MKRESISKSFKKIDSEMATEASKGSCGDQVGNKDEMFCQFELSGTWGHGTGEERKRERDAVNI